VGRVADVELVFTGDAYRDSRIMTVIELRRGAIRSLAGEASASKLDDAQLAKEMIASGLRASVRSSSPIAGQRSVDLDFHPEVEPRYSGFDVKLPEIPTAPTGMELLGEKVEATLQKISQVPIDEVLVQLQATLLSVQKLIEGPEVPGALRGLRTTLVAAERALAASEKTLAGMDGMTGDTRATLQGVDATMKSLQKTLAGLDRTLATIDRNVERSAELQHEGAKAFDEMGELLKTLRLLVDTLQRHPEALVRGKPDAEEKK
jgi:paraquat-inducible protein B